ncbi:hypothetical protein [Rubritalea tangerina]|uniref:hypothetical protein n=1 Tax=Rubritalea tangerina TaxID=430798 RepID=UPI00361807B5
MTSAHFFNSSIRKQLINAHSLSAVRCALRSIRYILSLRAQLAISVQTRQQRSLIVFRNLRTF